VRCLSTALRMRSSLRIQATSATFFGLEGAQQPLIELLDSLRVVARGDEGTHVQRSPHPRSPTPHRAPTSKGTGIPIERGDAHQGGELLASEAAEFGQLG
jgi:hypothetical protein